MIYLLFAGMLPAGACRRKYTGVSGSATYPPPKKRIRTDLTVRQKVFSPLCWRMPCLPPGKAC